MSQKNLRSKQVRYDVISIYLDTGELRLIKDAIECYSNALKNGDLFDAVILDLTIPGGMGGKEALTILKEIDPEVKAIVSSGYSNNSIMSEYKKYGFDGIIPKPYSIEEVSNVLSKVVNSN